ncbi:MAG: SWIM zinc finger family protein [Desulfovibrio sp.]|nr:SWIM zinc finger family protein [Desulfovibrio sp.]
MSYEFFEYVPVEEKEKRASRMLAKLQGKGTQVQPILAFTGALAKTFWGKSWCQNLELYADYANRLSRGRSYVRHGCLCHLEIAAGQVKAKVMGSRLYQVRIDIAPLAAERWQAVCARCQGQIATLIELLQGKLSREVMGVICDPEKGIFPAPKEVRFSCSCPDSANMCKHVAATLYGVGRRLDDAPEQIFTLRCVNADALLPQILEVSAHESAATLHVDDMGALFGIDLILDGTADASMHGRAVAPAAAHTDMPASGCANEGPQKCQVEGTKPPAPALPQSCASSIGTIPVRPGTRPRGLLKPQKPTGMAVCNLHRLSGLSAAAFAAALGVTVVTVERWEGIRGALRLKADSLQALLRFQEQLLQKLNLGAS